MSSKYFSKNKFWYGYKGELLFQDLVPGCKKQSNQADFKYKDLQIEIGRSKQITNKRFKVYFRKLFYNIFRDHHGFLKKKNPHHVKEFVLEQDYDDGYFLVPFNKFIFIYFTNSLKKCAIFTYQDMLDADLKKGYKGEFYFDMKTKKLYDVLDIPEYLEGCSEYSCELPKTLIDLGVVVLE